MVREIKIDDLTCQKGEKIRGWVDICLTYNQPIRIPVIIVCGKEAGRTLCVTAATHGDEYEGIDAIISLASDLDPAEMSGNLLAFPVLNVIAFDDIFRVGHYDYLNLNRSFPGNKDGFLTERITSKMIDILFNGTKIDALIDFHGGGWEKFIGPLATFSDSEACEGHFTTLDLAKSMGSTLLWKRTYPPDSIAGYCAKRGVPAIVFEAGGGGSLNESIVSGNVNGLKNVMKRMGILQGELTNLPKEYVAIGGALVHSKTGGFWRLKSCQVGDAVNKGDFLGEIVDLHGNVIETFTAGTDGLVVCFRTGPRVHPGDWVYWVGPVLETLRG